MGSPSREDDAAAVARRIVQEALAARAEAQERPAAEARPSHPDGSEPTRVADDAVRSAAPLALTPPPASPPPGPLPLRTPAESPVPEPPRSADDPQTMRAPPTPDAGQGAWHSLRWLAVAVLGAVSLVVLLVLSTQALRAVLDLGP